MGTNSALNLYNPKVNKFKSVSAHWDGYYSYAGMQLLCRYRNLKDVITLVNEGAISSYGAPLSLVGITPEIIQNMSGNRDERFELNGFTTHYGDKASVVDGAELIKSLKKYPNCYDYCYIDGWWYVSRREKGKAKLVPLTYDLCGYKHDGNGCSTLTSLDIVVHNIDTDEAFTYDYFALNAKQFQSRRDILMPSILKIRRIANELAGQLEPRMYNGMLQNYLAAEKQADDREDTHFEVVHSIQEAPWVQIPNALYIRRVHYRCPEYYIVQSKMHILRHLWKFGVQLMFDVTARGTIVGKYCRINIPEFEENPALIREVLGITNNDFVTLYGLHWLQLKGADCKIWTVEQYNKIIHACDRVIEEKHPPIEFRV